MTQIDTAVILAAGLGSRLGDLTESRPKGFLPLGGQTLVERSIDALLSFGIQRVLIGTGYLAEHYEALAASNRWMECVLSDRFETTGSMYTLYNMRRVIDRPFLLLESDLLYEHDALARLLATEEPDVVLSSDATGAGDEVFIETDDDGLLVQMSKDRSQLRRFDAELVGITKVSMPAYRAMCAAMESKLETKPGLDYEHALVEAGRSRPIRVLRVDGLVWCEIDDAAQLERARTAILPVVQQTSRAARRRAV